MSFEEIAKLVQLLCESNSNDPNRPMLWWNNTGVNVYASDVYQFIGCNIQYGAVYNEPKAEDYGSTADGQPSSGIAALALSEEPEDNASTAGGHQTPSPPNLANGPGNGESNSNDPNRPMLWWNNNGVNVYLSDVHQFIGCTIQYEAVPNRPKAEDYGSTADGQPSSGIVAPDIPTNGEVQK